VTPQQGSEEGEGRFHASTAITHTGDDVFMTKSRSQSIESPIKCPSTALSNRRSGRVPGRPTPSG
jgi:hypothetical protein